MPNTLLQAAGAFALGIVVGYIARYFFPQFVKKDVRSLGGLLGCLFAGSAVAYISHLLSSPESAAVYPVGLLVGLVGYSFLPIRDEDARPSPPRDQKSPFQSLSIFQQRLNSNSDYRIFIFALGRSGKTTLIKQLLYVANPADGPSKTEDFSVFTGRITLSGESRQIPIAIADYKGQKPSQVLTNAPEDFFGTRGHRLTNILIFQVDLVPEVVVDNAVRSDSELVDMHSSGAMRKLQERIQRHNEHLSSAIVELVFSVAVSPNLHAVRLLINKIDLVDQIVDRGYLGDVTQSEVRATLTEKLKPIISRIENACRENNIADLFSWYFISAKEGYNVKAVFSPLFRDRR